MRRPERPTPIEPPPSPWEAGDAPGARGEEGDGEAHGEQPRTTCSEAPGAAADARNDSEAEPRQRPRRRRESLAAPQRATREPLGRGIRRSELDSTSNPYNTYQIDGLPPTPIANPGRDAIAAVLNPPEGEYYYFVADGTGGHAFASSLAEHNRNVARWRRIERERAQGG